MCLNSMNIDKFRSHLHDEATFKLMCKDVNLDYRSVTTVIDVINRKVSMEALDSDSIDWKSLNIVTDYFKLSPDFIYPLFLTISDRKIYFDDNTRNDSMRDSNMKDDDNMRGLIEVKIDEMKKRKSSYDVIIKDSIRMRIINPHSANDLDTYDILRKLSHIPNLFVAGGYALAIFTRSKKWKDVDIFAYGPNALESIIKGVKVCLELTSHNSTIDERADNFLASKIDKNHPNYFRFCDCAVVDKKDYTPIRTRHAITIPIKSKTHGTVIIQFILIKYLTPYHILSNFDIDSCCIGFEIVNTHTCRVVRPYCHNITVLEDDDSITDPVDVLCHCSNEERLAFYALPRFVRAFETGSNTIDPTKQNTTYIRRLIKYSNRGFDIAIPGFNKDTVRINPSIMKLMLKGTIGEKLQALDDLNLVGLESLVVSSILNIEMMMGKLLGDVYNSMELWDIYDILKRYELILSLHDSKNSVKEYLHELADYRSISSSNENKDVDDSPFNILNESYQIGNDILRESDIISDDNKLSFVVGDVLGEQQFSFRFKNETKHIRYKPRYPVIKLIDEKESIDKIYTSFYDRYYTI